MDNLDFTVNSDPANGNSVGGDQGDGSTCAFTFNKPPQLPRDCKAKVSCLDALIWNTTPNVEVSGASQNNKFYVTYNGTLYTVTLPYNGQYVVSTLSAAINRDLTSQLPAMAGLISLTGDTATNRVIMTITPAGVATLVTFNGANTFSTLIGWTANATVPSTGVATTTTYTETAANIARFDAVQAYQVNADFCPGMARSGADSTCMAFVPITAKPGSQIVYSPYSPTELDAATMKSGAGSYSVWITNQNGTKVNMGGQYWSARFRLSWYVPLAAENAELRNQFAAVLAEMRSLTSTLRR